jgi:hypothetical protein
MFPRLIRLTLPAIHATVGMEMWPGEPWKTQLNDGRALRRLAAPIRLDRTEQSGGVHMSDTLSSQEGTTMTARPGQPRDQPEPLPSAVVLAIVRHDADQGTLALQPKPLRTETDHHKATCEIVTHIRREWADGDSGPGGRCTRCFACIASNNVCRLMVNRFVSPTEAREFSPRALGVDVSAF